MSKLFDLDDIPDVKDIEQSDEVTLRPYQVDSVNAVFTEWEAGNRATLVVLPTGTGKSVVFSGVIERLCK